MKLMQKLGELEKNLELVAKIRIYFQDRVEYMDKTVMLQYLYFFLELGLVFEDKDLMVVIQEHLTKNYYKYELDELFKTYKIISHNFYRN